MVSKEPGFEKDGAGKKALNRKDEKINTPPGMGQSSMFELGTSFSCEEFGE